MRWRAHPRCVWGGLLVLPWSAFYLWKVSVSLDDEVHLTVTTDSQVSHRRVVERLAVRPPLELVSKYRYLFHKYRSDPAKGGAIRYVVTRELAVRRRKSLVTHLHCHNLSSFGTFFGAFESWLRGYSDLVVTYTEGAGVVEGAAMLQIPNQGMDVGAKFCAVDYLRGFQSYDFLLFLHSKSDPRMRVTLYEWYLNQVPFVARFNDESGTVGGVFDPFLTLRQKEWPKNRNNLYDLVDYLGLERDYFSFPVGNCFFLAMDVARFLYTDPLLYSALNTKTSLDFGWFVEYYKHHISSSRIEVLQKSIRQGRAALNNLHLGTGHDGLADSMIEHAFERVVFLAVRKFRKIGLFDLRQGNNKNGTWLRLSSTKHDETAVTEEPSALFAGRRSPLRFQSDLADRLFSRETTRHDRVLFFVVVGSPPVVSHWDHLLLFARLAATVVVLTTTTTRREDGEDGGGGLETSNKLEQLDERRRRRRRRNLFIVDDVLTEDQCQSYAATSAFEKQDLKLFSPAQLREHYLREGIKGRRFVDGTLATVRFLRTSILSKAEGAILRSAKVAADDYREFLFVDPDDLERLSNETTTLRPPSSALVRRYSSFPELLRAMRQFATPSWRGGEHAHPHDEDRRGFVRLASFDDLDD